MLVSDNDVVPELVAELIKAANSPDQLSDLPTRLLLNRPVSAMIGLCSLTLDEAASVAVRGLMRRSQARLVRSHTH